VERAKLRLLPHTNYNPIISYIYNIRLLQCSNPPLPLVSLSPLAQVSWTSCAKPVSYLLLFYFIKQPPLLNEISLGQRETDSDNRLIQLRECTKPGVLNLLILAYPQIRLKPYCVPPIQSLSHLRTPKSEFKPSAYP
jgi:hypothetical protein